MNDINSWEVVGYIDPTLPVAKIVKPILRDPSNPDIYFYAESPETKFVNLVKITLLQS